MSADLVIVHLYPDLLRTYGDRGNVITLERRAQWRGFDVEVIPISRGESIPADTGLILLGGGIDGGTTSHVAALAEIIAAADPKPRLGIGYNLPIVYAGNKDARDIVKKNLQDKTALTVVDNLRPTLEMENLGPARDEIAELDFEKGRAEVHIPRPRRRRVGEGDIDLSAFDGGEDFGVLGEHDRLIGDAEPPRERLAEFVADAPRFARAGIRQDRGRRARVEPGPQYA